MPTQRLTKPPDSLKRFNTFNNRSMIFCRNPMPSTSSAMINIGFHTNSKWATMFGCICRKITSQDPIGSFVHFTMGLTPSPRIWMRMILNWVFPLPWRTPSIQCGPPSPILFTIVGHIGGSREFETHRARPQLHGTRNHLLHYGHTGQGNLPIEYPTLLSGQSKPATLLGKMAYQGSSSTKHSPSNGELNAMETIAS